MEVHFGPNAVDEPSLLYKLQRKIKVFNTNNPLSNRGYNLVSCTSKYGLVFIASPNGILSVYYLKELIDKDCEPQNLSIKLQVSPTHVSVNSNQEWLAVYGEQMLLVYKCMDFHNPEIRPTVSIKCDVNPGTFVSALQWNPCIPDTIGIVFFDGTILVSQVSTMQMKKIQSNARCLCWSPKGKQLVTGNNDGTLTQYKPDLSQMKMVPAPNLYQGAPVEVLTIHWISTYQFAVAYRNAAENTRPDVTIVNTPKGSAPSFCNYEDICYSMGNKRPWYYYLHGLTPWNLIITSSSNSVEIATLSTPDGSNWVQWCQTDEARPELPLTDKKQENYPVGICIDTAAIHQLPWGENETLPPMPLMHVVAQTGWLSIFNIINFNKAAPQICAPIQPLMLPTAALTRNIPDDVPVQQQQLPIQQQQPPLQQLQPPVQQQQPPVQQLQPQVQQLQPPVPLQPPQAQHPAQMVQLQQSMQQPQIAQPVQPIPQPQIQQQTMAPKPVPQLNSGAFQPTPTLPPYTIKKESTPPVIAEPTPPQPQSKSVIQVPKPQSAEVNAALKLEQEKINKAKANQELKNMLIKEVNDFQMELYNFMKLTHERQQKFQQDIQTVNLNMQLDMDTEKLKNECSIEDLRETIIQLKLELVRACAVVAEARAHAEVKDHQEWTQIDPLTAKRVASVKKMAYYVQNQLDQARKALDHKWNEMINKDQYRKPGERMIRPILDDVYQPLVKQQEILSRQQAVLKTLRNTMNACNFTPTFRSTSLLRSTPFRNKDPLSKLTKNILNMSIEPQNKAKDQFLTSQKLDALRDFLSNHKPIKIKPASVELTQHLENMKKKYEKSVKEREMKQQESKTAEVKQQIVIKQEEPAELLPKPQLPSFPQMPIKSEIKAIAPVIPKVPQPHAPIALKTDANVFKGQPIAFTYTQSTTPVEIKPDIVKESPVSSHYTSVNFKPAAPVPVVRTLFTDEPKVDKPQESAQKVVQKQLSEAKSASESTKSLLRQYILKDSQEVKSNESKNDVTFMGQNICSPTTFTFPKPAATATPSAVFPSKPITNIFNKNKESGPQLPLPPPINPDDETGETESAIAQKEKPQEDKPITNMFSLKTNMLGNKNQNIPDVLQSQSFVLNKVDGKFTKPKDEKGECKENVEKSETSVLEKKDDFKPSLAPMSGKAPSQSVIIVDLKKPAAAAKIEKINSSIFSNNPVSPPPTATKPQQGFVAIATSTNETTVQGNSAKLNITISKISDEKTVPEDSNATSATITISRLKEISEMKDSKTAPQPEVFETSISTTDTIAPKPTTVLSTTISSTNASVFTSNASVFTPASGTQTSPGSIFATQTTQGQVFGTQTTTSIFGTSSAQSLFSAAASKSLFGTTTTTQSIFGNSTATTQSSGFGSNSVFSSQSPTKGFGSTQSSVFGTTTPTQVSVFGTTQTSQGSIFGTQSQNTQSSVFGNPVQTTQASVFGTPTQSTQASVFGTPTQTTQASVFGAPTQTTQGSVFGTPTQTTQASVFGTPIQSTQASVFGTPTQTTQASVFGTPTQPTQASVFGTPTQTTQASVFGTPTQTTQSSIFGSPSQTTQSSVFGTPTQASVFGTTTPPTQPSVFGTPTTTQSGSIFGSNESDLFASASISTTSASQSGGNIFGGSSGSVFGNTNVFGSKSGFTGSSPTAANIFGGGASFGQKPATDFWGGGNSGGFGSTGFGQQATTQPSSIFGSSGGSFSTPSTQPFGSPQPFGENKPSVFGSPQQQSAPAFGGSPVFGSKSVFGGSPSFGSSAFGGFNKSPSSGFGAPATFGGGGFGGAAFGNTSPGKMFGNAPAAGFGSPTQSNATFETLATQNTLTFGNLAQQSGSPQAAPTFNTSPSFTGWRG